MLYQKIYIEAAERSVGSLGFMGGECLFTRTGCFLLSGIVLAASSLSWGGEPRRLTVAHQVLDRIAAGLSVDALVLFDDLDEVALTVAALPGARKPASLHGRDFERYIGERGRSLSTLKRRVLDDLADTDVTMLADYQVLPVAHVRIGNARALERLKAHGKILSIDENPRWSSSLVQSLPLINQPAAQSAGYSGSGQTVCVLDTGVDYTRAAFGSCTASGTPAGCKIVASVDVAPNDGQLDDPASMHGTNVAAIILGVAPGARVAALDVFNGTSASGSDILAGINWCVTNRAAYNIVAINMSLGGGRYFSPVSPVDTIGTALQTALNSGIVPVVASGNDGYSDSIAMPAAYSNVVSVGAVYDSSFGSAGYAMCTDQTAADKVACFSNSASFLTMLAPGASIAAASITMSGTSQATPHAAGAVAVLAAAFPSDNTSARIARLKLGTSVTDARNGTTKPRLNLTTALAQSNSDPPPVYGDCSAVDCRKSYGAWRARFGRH